MEGPPAPPAPPPVAPTTKSAKRRTLTYGNRHHQKKKSQAGCRWEVFVEATGDWPATGTIERVTFTINGVHHHRAQAPYTLKWKCHGRDQKKKASVVRVGITVEFAAGSEPPLTLEHGLTHDATSWTDVYLPTSCKAVAPPALPKKNLKTLDHLFDQLVTSCSDSPSRLTAVGSYLTAERLRKTLSGSSQLNRSLFLVRGDKVTLLHIAVLLKDHDLIELLLRHGADPNQSAEALSKTYVPPDPKTRKVCRPEELCRTKEVLVERGTPLHLALMTDNAEATVRLLQAGADPWLKARKARKTKGKFSSPSSVEYADVSAFHLICDRALAIAAKLNEDDTKRQEILSTIFTLLTNRCRISGGDLNKLIGKVESSSPEDCFLNPAVTVTVKRAAPLWLLLHALADSPLEAGVESFLWEMIALGADPLVPCGSRVSLVERSDAHEATHEGAIKAKRSETWANFNCFHLAVLNQHCRVIDVLASAVGLPTKPAKVSVTRTTVSDGSKEDKHVISCESLVELVKRLAEPEMQRHFETMLGQSEL